jgi:hypothetical protein
MKNCLAVPSIGSDNFNDLHGITTHLAKYPSEQKGMEQNLPRHECNARRFPTTTTHVFHKT